MTPAWSKILDTNQWIYAVINETLLNVVCDNQPSLCTINGTGLLKLQPTCVVKQNDLKLIASIYAVFGFFKLQVYPM